MISLMGRKNPSVYIWVKLKAVTKGLGIALLNERKEAETNCFLSYTALQLSWLFHQ